MLEIRNAPLSLRILTCAVLLGIATPGAPALAQSNDDAMAQMNQDAPPQQSAQGNPICMRLEGQLAPTDRGAGTGDPAKDEQIRRYQEAQAKQQGELDRVTQQAKRMGCESSGFFSLFNGRYAQCAPQTRPPPGPLPPRLRPHLRRRLFPGVVRHLPAALSGRRENLQVALPG